MTTQEGETFGHWFTPPVSSAGTQTSITADVSGPLISAARARIGPQKTICAALEFGTVPFEENTEAKIFENWTHRYLSPGDPLHGESSRRMRDAYYCSNPRWKANVLARTHEIVRALHERLDSGWDERSFQ